MPRIPDADLNRWKASADLLALMRADGMEFNRSGKDWVCLCPFHADTHPSLRVTPKTAAKPCDLWNCPACHTGGDPLQWLVKFRKLSFRAAVEFLRSGSAGGEVALSGRAGLPCPLNPDMSAREMLAAVMAYYHERLTNPTTAGDALAHLAGRGLNDAQAIAHFGIGYADRSLGLRLPVMQLKAGAAIRQQLAAIGLYRADTMKEHLAGCLTLPMRDPVGGAAVKTYGRILHPSPKRFDGAKHLYLPGHHQGILNPNGYELAKHPACGHLVLCESPLDAVALWANGVKNCCSAWGTGGFTDDHMQALQHHGVREVRIAFDRDESGDKGASRVAEQLKSQGVAAYRVELPMGLDVNAYALKFADKEERAEALKQAIRCASFVHGQGASAAATLGTRACKPAEITTPPTEPAPELNASASGPLAPSSLPSPAPLALSAWTVEHAADFSEVIATAHGERLYRVRGLHHNTGPERLKVGVKAWRKSNPTLMHADTLDLSQARARASFIAETGRELGESDGVIKGDIAKLFGELEAMRDGMNAERDRPKAQVALADSMPAEEREAALGLLRSPNLLARIVSDFAACGMVGEETNKLVGYLAATSRLLARPLAIVVQSSSAAGKSSLLDAVLDMMPGEAQVRYSAMTGQSLYYMGGDSLKHKILAIAEEEGAEQASYSLKLLQSEGKLAIATPSKDAQGQIKTERYEVEGPCSIFLTTTAADVDEELLNRCLVLTVDEDQAQTKRIHHEQRKAETLDGLKAQVGKARTLRLHQNAQRLLESVKVVNPLADKLTFLDGKTRARRDQPKYLSLIRTLALLHQFQRERKEHTCEKTGEIVPYIEATREDIAAANRLMGEVLGRSLDELPPQSRRLLGLLFAEVKAQVNKSGAKVSETIFTRRDARGWSGWTDPQVRKHLEKLVEMEYVTTRKNGGGFGGFSQYALLYNGEAEDDPAKRFALGLLDPDTLAQVAPTTGMMTPNGVHADSHLPPGCTPDAPHLHGEQKTAKQAENQSISPQGASLNNATTLLRSVVVEAVVGQDQEAQVQDQDSKDPAARASFLAALLAADQAQLKEKPTAGAPESEAA